LPPRPVPPWGVPVPHAARDGWQPDQLQPPWHLCQNSWHSTRVSGVGADHYAAGESYTLFVEEFHIIRVESNRDREPPSLSGLYNRVTPDQVLDRFRKLERLGVVLKPGDKAATCAASA